jgi:hypothetical protein
MARPPAKLPDPWLFDSEALLRELDRCRETVLQIPITNPNATHFGIQLAVSAIWNLTENLRYLLHLHREGQRALRRKHEAELANALSQPAAAQPGQKIVRMTNSAPSPRHRTVQQTHGKNSSKKSRKTCHAPFPHARGVSSPQVA